jgi:hypothetical protein
MNRGRPRQGRKSSGRTRFRGFHPRLFIVVLLRGTAAFYLPVPNNPTQCVPPKALSRMATCPMRPPAAVGANVTSIMQLAPALSLLPQVLVSLKSPALTPPTSMEKRAIGAVPALVSTTVCAGLEVPTG